MSALRRESERAEDAGVDNAAVDRKIKADDQADVDKAERVKSEITKTVVAKPEKPEPLEARIKRTEERIADRRAALALRAADVNGKVRKSLSSPLLIVGAAGAGFVFAQFKKKPRPEREERRKDIVAKPSIFATITDALTLATTLLAMMPLIRSKAKEGVQEATGEVPET